MYTNIIVLSLLFATVYSSDSMENILSTNQYFLATQQGCLTQIETEVQPGSCPQILQKPPATGECRSNSVRAHLIRDPDELKAPKLGLVHNKADELYFQVWDINVTNLNNSEQNMIHFETPALASNTIIFRLRKGTVFIGSLFDSNAQMLYTMSAGELPNYDGEMEHLFFLDAYQITNIFNETTRPLAKTMFKSSENIKPSRINNERFDWSEDPYTNEFYYREHNGLQIVTYSSSFQRILDVILTGNNGKVLTKSTKGGLLSVTGGLFSEKKVISAEGSKKKTVTSYIRQLSSTLAPNGITCEYSDDNATLPHHIYNPVIVIKDFDYCLLKYGKDFSKQACDQERMDWINSKGLNKASPENTIKLLIISIFCLSLLAFFLIAYIYWLHSTTTVEADQFYVFSV